MHKYKRDLGVHVRPAVIQKADTIQGHREIWQGTAASTCRQDATEHAQHHVLHTAHRNFMSGKYAMHAATYSKCIACATCACSAEESRHEHRGTHLKQVQVEAELHSVTGVPRYHKAIVHQQEIIAQTTIA